LLDPPGGIAEEGGDEGGYGPQERAQVPGARSPPQRKPPAPELADPAGPAGGGVAGTGGDAHARARLTGGDATGLATGCLPGGVSRLGAADPGAARARLEGAARPGQGGLLRAGPRAGSVGRLGLHAHGGPGRDDRRPAVRPPAVPLRVDALELGVRAGVLRGELRHPQRGLAERPVESGRRAAPAPHRPHDTSGARRRPGRGLHGELPGLADPLRAGGRGDQPGQRPRERRLRAKPPPREGGGGAGAAAPRQPRLRQPGRLRGVRAGAGAAAERAAAGGVRGRGRAAAAAAGAAAGDGGAVAGAGAARQHDPGAAQHLLGAGAADRRVRRGAGRRRGDRGVVRRGAGAADAAAARAEQARDRLPAHYPLAGAQAGRVRPLRLPGRPVPDHDLPARLRRLAGTGPRAGRPRLRAAAVPGGPGG
jgi:hypothetical protein